VTSEYLTGELSVLLEKLLAVTGIAPARDVANLRYQVESEPVASLAAEMAQALALADWACWHSLANGDAQAFDRQAAICAEMRMFGTCAGLIDEELRTSRAGLTANYCLWISGTCTSRRGEPGGVPSRRRRQSLAR